MDYMSMLTDKSESELVAELGDKIYQNPQKNMRWESADEYLTGNIRAKLAAAEEAGLERNIEALRAVMPQRIEAADISVKLGSAWIDPEYIRQFILETLKPDFQTRNSIEVIYSEAEGYEVWAVEQVEGSIMLQDFQPDKAKKYAIILGNEVKGVQQEVVDQCDGCIEIPQFGTKHSLNVSVTAGILVWEFARKMKL